MIKDYKEYHKNYQKEWARRNAEKIRQYKIMNNGTYIKIAPEKINTKYRLIKKYENFVLCENIKYGFKECFNYFEFKQLEIEV